MHIQQNHVTNIPMLSFLSTTLVHFDLFLIYLQFTDPGCILIILCLSGHNNLGPPKL